MFRDACLCVCADLMCWVKQPAAAWVKFPQMETGWARSQRERHSVYANRTIKKYRAG